MPSCTSISLMWYALASLGKRYPLDSVTYITVMANMDNMDNKSKIIKYISHIDITMITMQANLVTIRCLLISRSLERKENL
jgi:hypothetical protein